MIDNAALLSELYSIQESYSVEQTAIDQTNKRCVIDVKERTINIPVEIESLGVQYDHRSYKLLFEIDRYVHGVDLLTQTCVIQWLSKNGTTERSGLHPVVEIEAIDNDKLLFVWELYEDETRIPGTILFAVNFYTMKDENSFLWSYNTLPASSTIKDTLDVVINPSDEITPSLLMVWNDKMVGIERLAHDSVSTSSRSAHEAEAWAHGRADFPNTMLDNAKYYKDLTQALYDEAKYALSDEKDRVVEEAKNEIVNLAKDEVIAVVKEEVTNDVINDVYAVKDESITAINDATTVAIQEVVQTKDDAIDELMTTGDERYAVKESIPTKVSELENDSKYLTEVPEAPVKSVNGKTGDVDLSAEDVGAVASKEFTEFKVDYENHSHTAEEIGARPDDWMPTASDVGAIPIINAQNSNYDMDAIIASGSHFAWYECNNLTLGTPYAKGVTSLQSCKILSFASSSKYGTQVAFTSGADKPVMYIRSLANGKLTDWTTGYLPLSGGTLNGHIVVDTTGTGGVVKRRVIDGNVYNAYFSLLGMSVGASTGLELKDADGKNLARFYFNKSGLWFSDGSVSYELYGKHNKPSGSYTGNGSETLRTINTGGIGNVLFIWGTASDTPFFAIITPTIGLKCTKTGLTFLTSEEAKFENGVYTLAKNDPLINFNGVTYNYQVV